MPPKTPAPTTLRPRTPRLTGISRKVIIAVTAAALLATVGIFVFDPGIGLNRNEPGERLPLMSNVKPDLSMLPSDYSGTGAASRVVPEPPPLPPPGSDPRLQPARRQDTAAPATGSGRKRRGIAVGGDDGLGDHRLEDARMPGFGMAGMPVAAGDEPRTAAQDFRRRNGDGADMYLPRQVQAPMGEWEIWPGTVIPAKLASATNSELGGNVVARVSADIHDSRTGRCRMIPRDSTVFGKLSDEVQYGQRRQQAVWTLLILPDGRKLDLMGMDATDGAGRAGIAAEVNNHYGRLAGAALAATVLDVLGGLGRSGNRGTQVNIGGAAAENAESIGGRIIQRELNVRPTLEQAIGSPVSLMVDRTIVLGCYDE
jgi:type IV secretory pathway VirB10-like protein